MASTKEIRNKIKSIKSTQKITRAMEMVAASKMKKVQQRMRASRPYADKIVEVVNHLATGRPEYRHHYLQDDLRKAKSIGIIVISTDRGLCGGLNANLFRAVIEQMKQWEDAGVSLKFSLIGGKADSFFKRMGAEIIGSSCRLGEAPTVEELIGAVQVMLKAFQEKAIDALYIAYNTFVNTMSQKPTLTQLLPIAPSEESKDKGHYWDYIYEPDAKSLLDSLLSRYIESMVYQGSVENAACEQAARMVAMKSASDNAGQIMDDFQLIYNKARQAAITQELSEIVSGAAAV